MESYPSEMEGSSPDAPCDESFDDDDAPQATTLIQWGDLSKGDSFLKSSVLTASHRFKYRHLVEATENFSPKNIIDSDRFYTSYKGNFKTYDGRQAKVVVKQKIKMSETDSLLGELIVTSQTSHKNIVMLKGWCYPRITWKAPLDYVKKEHNGNLFLVYERMPNGTLRDHLEETMAVLPWATRYKIVKDMVSALHYLHHECTPYISHRYIQPSSILLDDDFNAKLGDFWLSIVAKADGKPVLGTAIGTVGYMDPLCMKNRKIEYRRSSDIYSFGIVLLEIAHGGECNRDLVWEKHASEPADTFTKSVADTRLNGEFDQIQMERVIVLGLRCSDYDEYKRPSMIGAMKFLEHGGELRPATAKEQGRRHV